MPPNRFILPAGLMPPVLRLSDFFLYDDLISGRFSNTSPIAGGFEYYLVISQDPQKINTSPIGGKIRGVHGPWTRMSQYKGLYPKLLQWLFFRPPVGHTAHEAIINTIKFAHEVGADYVVFHTSELDFINPESEVKEMSKLCQDFGIKLFLENEGKLGLEGIFKGKPYPSWYSDCLPLYQKFGIPIVFDPATIETYGQSINNEWRKLVTLAGKGDINKVVGHIHPNEYIPSLNSDHGVMKSPHHQELFRQINQTHYTGLFTLEVNAIQNRWDKLVATVFGGLAILGVTKLFPGLTRWYGRFSQKNLYDSIKFCQKYLN